MSVRNDVVDYKSYIQNKETLPAVPKKNRQAKSLLIIKELKFLSYR